MPLPATVLLFVIACGLFVAAELDLRVLRWLRRKGAR